MNAPFPRVVVEMDPGEGNLDARAYIAAVLGPARTAYGSKAMYTLTEGSPLRIGANSGSSRQVAYAAVALTGAQLGGPKIALLDGQSQLGSSSMPAALSRAFGSAGIGFSSVLLPGDELYAQAAPGEGPFNIVISLVWF